VNGSQKKGRERAILDFYLKMVGIKGDVEAGERPDFVVTSGERKIGIEITEYHQPKSEGESFPRRTVEAEWQKLRKAVVEYRETNADLDNLCVRLTFRGMEVPPERRHADFIAEIHALIQEVQEQAGEKVKIKITDRHAPLLKQYLSRIAVRNVGCYMEWDWNHDFGGVGTSDAELLALLERKLAFERPSELTELHLVVAGDGQSVATYIGFLTPELLGGFASLNEALDRSAYTAVTILNYEESCRWQKDKGWSLLHHATSPSIDTPDNQSDAPSTNSG
jgi:hypothetical protein